MDKINLALEQLKNLYKQKYEQNEYIEDQIQKLERKMIHTDDGDYFIVAIRNKNCENKKWHPQCLTLFESKEVAERHLKHFQAINGENSDFQLSIVRAVLFETDITNVL